MFDLVTRFPRRALLLNVIVGLIALVYLLIVIDYTRDRNDGNIGALLDDTWIHVRFAWNIAQGDGLTYNDGVLTAGATSPLWVLLLSMPFALFEPDTMQQVDLAIYMSAAGHVLTVCAIASFGWWMSRIWWIGLAAGIITAATGRYMWMGLTGMEITTFTLLCILAIWSHSADIRQTKPLSTRTGMLLALATLARPEAYLLTVLIGGYGFILVPLRRQRTMMAIRDALMTGWRGILYYVLLAGIYPISTMIIAGYPLPNTFRAKSYLGREYPDLPRALLWMTNQDHGALFIGLAIIGIVVVLWRSLKPNTDSALYVLWAPLFILAVLFLGAERYAVNHSRYVAPAIPFLALSAVLGIQALATTVARFERRNIPPMALQAVTIVALFAVTLAMTLERGTYHRAQVANDVYQLRAMHVQAGEWFLERTSPDDSIALNDVGAIVHISGRTVLDLEGLVSIEVIDATAETPDKTCEHDLQLARLIMEDETRFIGIFPWFYPCLSSWDGALQPETVFAISGPTVLAGGEMVIYYPVWERWPMQRAVPTDATPIDVRLQDGVELAAYQVVVTPQNTLNITLWWQAYAQPATDYHVFVHIVDATGQIVQAPDGRSLQHDSAPQRRATSQFNTSWWRKGDVIEDIHEIPLDGVPIDAIEGLAMNVGMYRFPAPDRLERQDEQGDAIYIPLNGRAITGDVAQ